MGLFGISGDTWKKIGKVGLGVGQGVLGVMTGGASLPLTMGLQGALGAASGAMGGGGLKGALLGGGIGAGLGAIPGGGAASGVGKGLVKPTIGQALKSGLATTGKQYATQLGSNLLGGVVANNQGGGVQTSPYTGQQFTGQPGPLPTRSPYGLSAVSQPGGGNVYRNALPAGAAAAGGGAQPPAPGTAPGTVPGAGGDDLSWLGRWGPAIATGAGGVVGAIVSKKAQEGALKRSPEEAAALGGANTIAGQAGGAAEGLMQESRPYISQPAGYYQTLLHGNRAAMAQATAAPTAALREQGRGQQTQLAHSGIRGAARDVLSGQINRDVAGKVAGQTTGVQPWAAGQLAGLGQNLQQTSASLYPTAGSIYTNVLGQGFLNRKNALEEGRKTGEAAGKLVADIGTVAFGGRKKAGKAAGAPTPESQNTTPFGPPPAPPGYGQIPGGIPADVRGISPSVAGQLPLGDYRTEPDWNAGYG